LANSWEQNFGTALAVPFKLTPNEFGALKIRHQPLAEASGMGSFRTYFLNLLYSKVFLERTRGKT